MTQAHATEYLAECFWPGVQDSDLISLDERAIAGAAAVSVDGAEVRYLGSLVMREDEVVLCRFAGPERAVRRAAELGQVPFERILEAGHSPGFSEAIG